MNMDNTNEIIQSLADLLAMDEFQKFSAASLVQRFVDVEDKYRHDAVIRNVGGAVERMAARDPNHELSKSDIAELYRHFSGLDPSTKFKEVFADLLPTEDLEAPKQQNIISKRRVPYNEQASARDLTTAQYEAIEVDELDAALEHSVESLIPSIEKFDPELMKNSALHDPRLVEAGAHIVATQLESLGLEDVKATLKHGVQGCLLYLASFPTTRGTAHVNVPLGVEKEGPILPSLFADPTGKRVYAFSTEGIEELMDDMDEIRRELHAEKAKRLRTTMANDTVRDPANNATEAIEVDEIQAYVEEIAPKTLREVSVELADVEAILENAVVQKASRYNTQAIGIGRDLVHDELKKIGFVNPQVRFSGDFERGLAFDAKLWTKRGEFEITIPVEVNNGQILFPSSFVGDDGEIRDLSADQIDTLVTDGEEIEEAELLRHNAAFVSLDYNSLRKIAHKATFDHKQEVAKQALSLIRDKFGEEAYSNAVSDYQTWIEEATTDYECRCAGCTHYKQRNAKYASDYCGLLHTGCKNVVKKAGVCTKAHLTWDRQHDDSYQGVITTSQIRLT